MFPFTLVIILFIYGEFCRDIETRYVARLFQYTLSVGFLSQFFLSPEYNLLLSAALPVSICLYTIATTSSKMVRFIFGLVATFTSVICYSLFTADASVIPWDFFHDHSHRILRESLVFAIGSLAYYNKAKNHEVVNWFAAVLIYIEYLTL